MQKSGFISVFLGLLALGRPCHAEPTSPPARPGPTEHGAAAEVNLLWPFIGISELKVVLPLFGRAAQRAEFVTGMYLDYAQIVRKNAGKAFIIAPILGYRQFLFDGIHVELALTAGVRHESHHPGDDATLNDWYIRAWPAAGYQLEVSPRFYVNSRARVGLLVYRQTHWAEEKKVALAGDINFGARF